MPLHDDDVYADVYEIDKPDTDEFGRAKRDTRQLERGRDRAERAKGDRDRPRHRGIIIYKLRLQKGFVIVKLFQSFPI